MFTFVFNFMLEDETENKLEIPFQVGKNPVEERGGNAVIWPADYLISLLPLAFKLNQKDSDIDRKYTYTIRRIKEGDKGKAKIRFKIDLAKVFN